MNTFWKNKRVFVTGATGLVGAWLVKSLLEKGAFVVILLRDQDPQSELMRSGTYQHVTVINGCLEDYADNERAINEYEIDTVFHLGAQTIVGSAFRSPLPTFEANIKGSYNLLEACRVHKSMVKRIVIASSDKAYGSCDDLPYKESEPLRGQHPYDVSKSCTDLIAQTYYHTYNLPIVIARCGNIYGGGDLNWSRIIPGTISSLYNDLNPIIRSDGSLTRDYVFVNDAVEAYLLMAEAIENKGIAGEAFNFGPSKPYNVLEIVGTITKLMGKAHLEPIIMNQAKAEIHDQYLCSTKAHTILGWKPLYSLEEGLQETLSWYATYFKKN